MPTLISHPAVPLAIGLGAGPQVISRRLLVAGAVASALPDVDVVAFRFGIPYAADLGHRGITHSLLFAVLLAALGALCHRALGARPWPTFLFVLASAASHGILDSCTDGGLGVAFLWPISSERFFAPWQFIHVAPLSPRRLLSMRGVSVLASELLWVWMPSAVIGAALASLRHRVRPSERGGTR